MPAPVRRTSIAARSAPSSSSEATSMPSREACASCAVKRSSPIRSRRSRAERKRTRSSAPRAAPSSASARAGHDARVERRAAAREPRELGLRDRRATSRCAGCSSAARGRSRPPRRGPVPSARARAPTPGRPPTTGRTPARSRARGRRSSPPPARRRARAARRGSRKSSSEDRVGSTHARMTSDRRLEAPGLHVAAGRRRARARDDEAHLVGRRRPGAGRRHPAGRACTGARGASSAGAGASGAWRPSAVSSSRSA